MPGAQMRSLGGSLRVALVTAVPLLFSTVGGVGLVLRGARAHGRSTAAAAAPRQRAVHFLLTRWASPRARLQICRRVGAQTPDIDYSLVGTPKGERSHMSSPGGGGLPYPLM